MTYKLQEQDMTTTSNDTSDATECPMCGGTGGWPGIDGWVTCKPCNGTGSTPTDDAESPRNVH